MITIREINNLDPRIISKAFEAQGWHKTKEQYDYYLQEHENKNRVVLVAEYDNEFAGYLTVTWQSDYRLFADQTIPEIVDLNVLKRFQKKGIATQLIEESEKIVKENHSVIGIRVGLLEGYGNAQKLYVKMGYVPDGLGISKDNHFYEYFEKLTINDDLVMGLTKNLGKK